MKQKLILSAACVLLSIASAFSQPTPPGNPPPGPGEPVPLSGIEILLAAGGLLGSVRLMTNRLKRNN